jgi:molecular chaperone GrpE
MMDMNPKKTTTKVDELKEAYRHRGHGKKARAAERPEKKLEEQIRSAEEEAKKHYDKLLRVMAEFENFKKRIQKEKTEHLQYSNEKLLADLLPVLDDFDRVLDHVPEDAPKEVQAIAQGVELVRKNMMTALEKYGLKEIEAMERPFDPAIHEAVATGTSEELGPDTVMDVHRKGYMLNDRLLRPAMVTVAK